MHILKREVVTAPVRVSVVVKVWLAMCACSVALIGLNAYAQLRALKSQPLTCGISAPLDCAASIAEMFTAPAIVEDAPDACGITDPLACLRQVVAPIADAFRPDPELIVVLTPVEVVDCRGAETAYWACIDDAECPLSVMEEAADDLNICQGGPRR